MAGTIPLGRICWHELLTTDPYAAVSFYGKVVGWGILSWDQDPSYRMWTADGNPIGGLMPLPEDAKRMGAPPNWLWYGSTPNVDATVAQAERLGAKNLSGMIDVPNVGRMAVMSDPQSAVFAAYQPAGDTPGHDGEPVMGEISWHELATSDWKAAFDFYQKLFGWEKMNAMDMGPAGTYLMFGRMGTMVGGVYNKPPEMPAPPHWLCYARVPSADLAAAQAVKYGGKILSGPMDVPGHRVATCLDPQGAAFAVIAVAAVAAKPAAKPKAAAAKVKKVAKKKPAKAKAARRKATKRKPAKREPARRATKPRKPLRRKKKTAKRPSSRKGRRR